MYKQTNTLQEKIERVAGRLATLKAQQQAQQAREKARSQKLARQQRTHALLLWGVALEREARAEADAPAVIRDLLEKHLTRENERDAALAYLTSLNSQEQGKTI